MIISISSFAILNVSIIRTFLFLFRNILLTLYFYFNKINTSSSFESDELYDPLLKLVLSIINSKKPRSEFNEIGGTLKNDFLYEFLKRVVIIEDLSLIEMIFNSEEKFIDWDDILSLESLLHRSFSHHE